MDIQKVKRIIAEMSSRMDSEKDFLTELDNAIADGDHGINMSRGFAAAKQKSIEFDGNDIGALLKNVGLTLVSAIGGSAGPLYGTAFLKFGMLLAGKTEVGISDYLSCLEAAIEGVMMRGKAVRGEKTMLDAMIPALEAMKSAYEEGNAKKDVFAKGIEAARGGVEYTKTIAATKGRASYIGERSIGHQDPGATSFTYLLEVVASEI